MRKVFVPFIIACLAEEGSGIPKGVNDCKHLLSGVDVLPTFATMLVSERSISLAAAV
jgi:hypothetical protein